MRRRHAPIASGALVALGVVTVGALSFLASCSLTSLDGLSAPVAADDDGGPPSDASNTVDAAAPEKAPVRVETCAAGSVCLAVPAFWEAVAMAPAQCPLGFDTPTSFLTSVTAPPVTCACDCAGTQTCAGKVTLSHYAGANCQGTPQTSAVTVSTTCTGGFVPAIVAGDSYKLTDITYARSGMCSATVRETARPAPVQAPTVRCQPATVCPSGACIPEGGRASMCIARPGEVACPDGFPQRTLVARTISDTRACGACTCSSTLDCTITNMLLDNNNNCSAVGPYNTTVTTSCTPGPGSGYPLNSHVVRVTGGGSGACAVGAAPAATGAATLDPATTQTVCCP